MRLRPLLISLAVLVPAAGLVWWLQSPAPAPSESDPRVARRLVEPSALADAYRVRIQAAGEVVELARTADGTRWTILGEPALPADVSRLARLSSDLVAAKLERVVSAKAERIAGFELDQTNVRYLDASGRTLLDLDLGKTPEGGGRIVRFDDEIRAYLARPAVSPDASAASWRDTALVAGLKTEDFASLSIEFPDTATTVTLSRSAPDQPWTSPDTPEGSRVKTSALASPLGNLGTLRYTAVSPRLDPGVVAARVFPRTLVATTFAGRTVKFTFSRAPAPPVPIRPEPKEGDTPPPPPPAAPRPVYVEIIDSTPDAVLAAAAQTHAFEIGEWVYTGLPTAVGDLFEPLASTDAPAPASTSTEPISVTTEPLSIETAPSP